MKTSTPESDIGPKKVSKSEGEEQVARNLVVSTEKISALLENHFQQVF